MKKNVKLVKNVGADDSVRPMLQGNTMAKQNGITLVALVITIIVLLLLAVVSINIVQNSGLIEKAKLAKEEHRASAIQEQIDLFKNEQEIAKQNNETEPSINELIDKLQEQKLITSEEKSTIMQTGKIKIRTKEIQFKEVPLNYKKIEYLESTKEREYIDTGLKISNNTKIEIKGKQYNDGSSLTGVNPLLAITSAGGYWRFRFNNMVIDTNISARKSEALIVLDKGKCYLDNVFVGEITNNAFNSTYTNILFGRRINTNGNNEEVNKQRIYYFKQYENDILVQNLIPCLDSNNRPCMYDTVSGQTFYNQGTGEFIAGPALP